MKIWKRNNNRSEKDHLTKETRLKKSNESSGQIEEAETLTTERSNSGATERANDETIGDETAPMVQSTSGNGGKYGGKAKSVGTVAKREKKKRLFSYSSQDSSSSIESATSSRSGRKRTAVTKIGGTMIDHISKGGEKKSTKSKNKTKSKERRKMGERVDWISRKLKLSV